MLKLPKLERPRERLKKYGSGCLANQELLAIILRTGTKSTDVKEVAKNLLAMYEELWQFKDLTLQELVQIQGIGEVKAIEILAAIEFGKRVANAKQDASLKVTSTEVIGELLLERIGDKKQENVVIICLNTKNQILKIANLFKGTLTRSLIHPRELYKEALKVSAAKIIIAHNHPSGDLQPSRLDIEITTQIVQVGELMGIPLLDHLIVSQNGYISMKALRLL